AWFQTRTLARSMASTNSKPPHRCLPKPPDPGWEKPSQTQRGDGLGPPALSTVRNWLCHPNFPLSIRFFKAIVELNNLLPIDHVQSGPFFRTGVWATRPKALGYCRVSLRDKDERGQVPKKVP